MPPYHSIFPNSPLLHAKENQLSVCYFNARSIANKISPLHSFIQRQSPDVIFIVESWLTTHHHDALLSQPGYNIIRQDRLNKKGGGLLVLYKSTHSVVEKRAFVSKDFEYMCIDLLQPKSGESLRLFCVYLPPLFSGKANTIKQMSSCIAKHKTENFYLFGDFNMPEVDWKTLKSSKSCHNAFIELCLRTRLHQHIFESTTHNDSTLDLFFCDPIASNRVSSLEVSPPLCATCDHNMLEFELCLDSNKEPIDLPLYFCYQQGDYESFNAELRKTKWEDRFSSNTTIQTVYDGFLETVNILTKKYVPRKRYKKNVKQPSHILKMAKAKNVLYKKYKLDRSLRNEYKALSVAYDEAVSTWHREIEEKVCSSRSSRNFYKYANKTLKHRPTIPPLQSENGEYHTTDDDKANLLNNVFHTVFITDNGNKLDIPPRIEPESNLKDIIISPQTVLNALRSIPPKTSNTPDNFPGFLLRKIGPTISKFLSLLFNLSLSSNEIPLQWKTALVSAIHKKGSKHSPNNYRPISLTSVICRLFENILCSNLLNHLSVNDLLSSSQHGFLPLCSTTTQLLQALNEWTQAFYEKTDVNVIYTDLAKAFDKVSHPKLFEVVKSYGIDGSVIKWIVNFLTGRTQRVCVNRAISKPLPVLSGVPQGSVVGPLLFLLFIDDISRISTETTAVSLFADDMKIYSSDPIDLQRALNRACSFFKDRQLSLAHEKCEKITLSKKKSDSTFYLEDFQVKETDIVKDLGVFITSDLKWESHTSQIKRSAFQKCYLILKSFKSNCIWTLLKGYITFVRPTMEYATQVWNPYLKKDIRSLESVQRFFTKKICNRCGIPFSSYYDRLYKLNLKTLEYRRVAADLLMVYKILHCLVKLNFDDFFEFYQSPYETRRHKLCLKSKRCDDLGEKEWFGNRVVETWNKLPEEVVTAGTINSFRARLNNFDLSKIYVFTNFI